MYDHYTKFLAMNYCKKLYKLIIENYLETTIIS